MITTIIFDLDGTLMNTLDDLHDSISYALREAGLEPNPKQDTRRYLGNGIRNLVNKSVAQTCPKADEALKEHVFQTFRAYYVAHSMDKTAPYEGVEEMLRECRTRGFYTAIVSNKLAPAVKDLHQAFFAETIDVAIGETENVKRKPAPDMGDSEVDLKTAENSGLPCIAVSWGFRDRDFLIEQGAKTIIDQPTELFKFL